MTAEQDSPDLAAVMARHARHWRGEADQRCWSTGSDRCEPHRLAALALDLQAKVARVEGFVQQKAISARAVGDGWRERQWLDVLAMLERPALADQPGGAS